MSNEMTRSYPASAATARAPTTPAAGPESTVRTACDRARLAEIEPPFDCMMRQPAAAQPRFEPRQIPIDQRRHIGVHDRRAPALVLAVFGKHFGGHRHQHAEVAQPPRNLALVGRVDVGVQQAHGADVRPALAHGQQDLVQRGGIDRLERAPARIHAFAEPEGQLRFDERSRQGYEDVVELGARLSSDAQHVLEAGGRDQRHPRALALEHRIGRHGGAVHHLDAGVRIQFVDPGQDRARLIVGRGAELVHEEAAMIEADKVRERPASVYSYARGRFCAGGLRPRRAPLTPSLAGTPYSPLRSGARARCASRACRPAGCAGRLRPSHFTSSPKSPVPQFTSSPVARAFL